MISEPAKPKLVTSIKTQLHPASEQQLPWQPDTVFAEEEERLSEVEKEGDDAHRPVCTLTFSSDEASGAAPDLHSFIYSLFISSL